MRLSYQNKEDQTQYYFENDTNLNPTKLITRGSKENEVFYTFNVFAAEMGIKAKELQDELGDSTLSEERRKVVMKELRDMGKTVGDKRQAIADANPGLFISKIYRTMKAEPVPEPPAHIPDSLKRTWGYMYVRNHYWDNIDLGEDGLVRTPIFHNKLKEYFDKYVPPIPDTSIMLADRLINEMEARGSKEQFKYTIHFLLGYYQKIGLMCFDKGVHHIAKNYYCNGRAYWADSAFRQEMCEESAKMEPTICDVIAPDLNMPDSGFRQRYRLHDVKSPVTVLIFWDIDCGHCKKEIPIVKSYYDTVNKEDVFIYAVYTQGDWEGWVEYLRKNDLGFLNVANAFGEDDFRDDYNIISTPQIYVLDKDKIIRFKKIAAKDIPGIVNHLLEEQSETGSM